MMFWVHLKNNIPTRKRPQGWLNAPVEPGDEFTLMVYGEDALDAADEARKAFPGFMDVYTEPCQQN